MLDERIYKGALDCVMKTFKWEGVAGFYRGVGSPIVGSMIIRAFNYVSK